MDRVMETISLADLALAFVGGRGLSASALAAALDLLMTGPAAWSTSELPRRLITGEPLRTLIAARATLAAELMRALQPFPSAALTRVRTERWLLTQCYANGCMIGECAHASIAVMRYLAVCERPDAADRLARHIELLRQRRDGQGRWRGMPFYYALLALQTDAPTARDELLYAAPACKRALHLLRPADPYTPRRQAILQVALALAKPEHDLGAAETRGLDDD